jgi:hypothetical protein
MNPNEPIHTMTATEARGGQKLNMVRWVLIFGLARVIPGLGLVWYLTRP